MGAPRFDNSFLRLPPVLFAASEGARAPASRPVLLNETLARELGLDPAWLASPEGLAMLSGGPLPEGAAGVAMAYAGHQFGGLSPQLGDGRALLVGEVVAPDGRRFDLHLKGSGPTLFSRGGDGKATLESALREYVVGEAMAALGVPTTRGLAVVTTGETILRQREEPGAVFARVASSHVRVGTFQYLALRDERDALRALADHVVDRHYPQCRAEPHVHRALFDAVTARHASLVARWMGVGFIHGVMNTDNAQLAGETLDYGPCAFMDDFHPAKVFSSIDHGGRYAWGNQPSAACFNLARFVETLLPLLADDEAEAIQWARGALGRFERVFAADFERHFCEKLGVDVSDAAVIGGTLGLLAEQGVDFTLFFRRLTRLASGDDEAPLLALFDAPEPAEEWLGMWRERHGDGDQAASRAARMRERNPVFIPRNHLVAEALEQARSGDLSSLTRLNEVLRRPYDEQPEHAELEAPPMPHQVVERTFCGT